MSAQCASKYLNSHSKWSGTFPPLVIFCPYFLTFIHFVHFFPEFASLLPASLLEEILLIFEDLFKMPLLPLRLSSPSHPTPPPMCFSIPKAFVSSLSPQHAWSSVRYVCVLVSLHVSISDIHWAPTVFQAVHQGCLGDSASALRELRGPSTVHYRLVKWNEFYSSS